MTEEEGEAEFQELQEASDVERQREEFCRRLEEMGEAEVDRRVRSGRWPGRPDLTNLVHAWLQQQKTNRESRAVMAAEVTANAAKSSAKSAKVAARWAMWASLIALLAIVWNVWGS